MGEVISKIRNIFATKSLRDKVLFTLFILVVFRFFAHITVPGADVNKIKLLLDNQGNSALGVLSVLTGGAMENFSIMLMGLTPYINASIIMQLLAVIVPSLENLKKEGEQGQKKISQYTRLLAVPLSFVQSYGMLILVNKFAPGIVPADNFSEMLPMMMIVASGTILLMWLGELITEKGIGNGISLLIFAGIVSTVPQQLFGGFKAGAGLQDPIFWALIIATIILTIFVVYISEGERRVTVIYAAKKSAQQKKSFLPLKINQAGMIPIIFAMSLVSFPSIIAQFLQNSESENLKNIAVLIQQNFNPAAPTWIYLIIYSLLIYGFTFFYVSLVFEPKKIAENIQKRGGFIPGYRPGKETEEFLGIVTNRLCFWGGGFLAFVAIFPTLFKDLVGSGVSLFISGAGIIIVVSVVLDLIRRINSQLVMQDYDKL